MTDRDIWFAARNGIEYSSRARMDVCSICGRYCKCDGEPPRCVRCRVDASKSSCWDSKDRLPIVFGEVPESQRFDPGPMAAKEPLDMFAPDEDDAQWWEQQLEE